MGSSKDISQKLVDIDDVFKRKNPTLFKLIPGFILSYLKRIVHEDEINSFLDKHADLEDFEFVDQVILNEFGAKVESVGIEHIQPYGK